MYILPINNMSFYGKEVASKNLSYDNIRKMPDYYPNSTIETTLGWNHKIPKDKVYFAYPMEPVSEDLKRNVDYVVYDNEPKYPELEDIRKNYLEHNRTNYRTKFEEIREYFYRREMGGFANVEEAKNEQKNAAECTGYYDRAGNLRYQKETAEDEIKKLNSLKSNIQHGINNTEREITAQKVLKQSVEKHIGNLEKLKKPFEELKSIIAANSLLESKMYYDATKRTCIDKSDESYSKELQNTAYYYEGESAAKQSAVQRFDVYDNTPKNFDSVHDLRYKTGILDKSAVEQQLKALQKTIDKYSSIKNDCETTIQEMQAYIAKLQIKTKEIESKISFKNLFIEDCKSQLESHFEQFKKFYTENIIKLAKK